MLTQEEIDILYEVQNHYDWNNYDDKDLELLDKTINKVVRLAETINYAMTHSGMTYATLPDGKQLSCDMGYVEEFFNIIENYLKEK